MKAETAYFCKNCSIILTEPSVQSYSGPSTMSCPGCGIHAPMLSAVLMDLHSTVMRDVPMLLEDLAAAKGPTP